MIAYFLVMNSKRWSVSCGSVVHCVETLGTEANELVAGSGSQKKIWISKNDKIEGTDRRKEKINPVQTKLRIYMISFSDISRFATQTFKGLILWGRYQN